MRTKKEYRTSSRENYDRFIKENKVSVSELPYKKYLKNIELSNWMFIEYALVTGNKINLPYGFGSLAVNKKKLNRFKEYNGKKYVNLRTDWAKTKKLGKKVYHTNEHSDGFNYRWAWFPEDAKIHLSNTYVFKPCRYSSRAINQYIRKPGSSFKEMYLEWKK